VLSNVAVLISVAVPPSNTAGGQAGTTVTANLTASNVRGTSSTVKVNLTGPSTPAAPVVTAVTPTSVTATLDLRNLATGVYQLAVVNANADSSNSVSFSVTPGPPTLTSLMPACVVQSDTPATIALAGANFAEDTSGKAITEVMYSPDGTNWYAPQSTLNVTSPTAASVTFDTRNAYVDPTAHSSTYSVQVWNPSTSGLLKSASKTLKVADSAAYCP
jgi:hypothetical protein